MHKDKSKPVFSQVCYPLHASRSRFCQATPIENSEFLVKNRLYPKVTNVTALLLVQIIDFYFLFQFVLLSQTCKLFGFNSCKISPPYQQRTT